MQGGEAGVSWGTAPRLRLENGIEVRALSGFHATEMSAVLRPRTPSGLVLGFTATPNEEIKRGIVKLREVLKGLPGGV